MSLNNSIKFRYIVFAVIVLYFLPLFIQITTQPKPFLRFSLPYIFTQFVDEHQYFIMLNSILKDGDLDLKNNYQNIAFNGSSDGGMLTRGRIVERNTFVVNKQGIRVADGNDPSYYRDAFISGELKAGNNSYELSQLKEYSLSSPGLPILLSFLLFPFKSLPGLEPATIFISTLVSLLGLFFLFRLLSCFTENKNAALFITLCFGLATPVWYYAGVFGKESFVFFLLSLALYLLFCRKRYLLVGLVIALAAYIRNPLFLSSFLFFVYELKPAKVKERLPLIIPSILMLPVVIFTHRYYWYNCFMELIIYLSGSGHYLKLLFPFLAVSFLISMAVLSGYSPVSKRLKIWLYAVSLPAFTSLLYIALKNAGVLFGFMFSLEYGLLTFTPFIIYSFFGLALIFKKDKRLFSFILVNTLLLFLYYANFWDRREPNPFGWANRYLIASFPFLAIALLEWYKVNRSRLAKALFLFLLSAAFLINAEGVFANHLVRKFNILEMWSKTAVVAERFLAR
ncbi:MAG: hypothetical protein C4533_06485 [Candidatus Omnitrophota bacterium]|jgi:hypothetical protein|nr:MAG: hypothetical protein C4533_06485 [Candidatus Omnitrophota bacterium]